MNNFDKEFFEFVGKSNDDFFKERDKEFWKMVIFMAVIGCLAWIFEIISLDKGKKITIEDGVSKSRGRYYAYCPTCGKRCAKPQIIRGNNSINTCIFRCYSCNENFERKFDTRVLR